MRLIRAKSYRRMPWKNGGGETIEVAVSPPGAAITDFDWRVSMAKIVEDGAFSLFPALDRTLTVLDGAGIELTVSNQPPIVISGRPHAFAGDLQASARLIDGDVTDLNVMTRRGRFQHRVTPIRAVGATDFVVLSPIALLYCHAGTVAVEDEYAAPFDLTQGDTLMIEAQPNSLRLNAARPAELFLVEISPA